MIDDDAPIAVDGFDFLVAPSPLVLDPAERAAIEAGWRDAVAARPHLWNGSFFLFETAAIVGGRFSAQARATDFATFLHWRAEEVPDPRFRHVFPVAAVTSADDRLLLGVMSQTTANPGLAYPPSGSFDASDRVGDRLDPLANTMRELVEEVGLDLATATVEPGFLVIRSGPRRHALVQWRRSPLTAAEIADRALAHIAVDPHRELADIRLVDYDEDLADLPTVPYVRPLLARLAAVRDGRTSFAPSPRSGAPS